MKLKLHILNLLGCFCQPMTMRQRIGSQDPQMQASCIFPLFPLPKQSIQKFIPVKVCMKTIFLKKKFIPGFEYPCGLIIMWVTMLH